MVCKMYRCCPSLPFLPVMLRVDSLELVVSIVENLALLVILLSVG